MSSTWRSFRTLPRGALEFGQVIGHRLFGVEQAPANQHACHRAGDRLGDRLRQVQAALCHGGEVALVNNLAMMQDDEAVGEVIVQPVTDSGLATIGQGEWNAAQILRSAVQSPDPSVPAPYLFDGQNFADVVKRPAVPRRAIPVLPGHTSTRRHGNALHDLV
jgi:hypothetical protein